jgi:hypothetical protein
MKNAVRSFFIPLLFLATLTAISLASAQSNQPATRDQIYDALTGSWTGQLEYRDYQSNERVMLPTWLEIKRASDGRSLEYTYTYDDGPTKTVVEKSTVMIDPVKNEYTSTSIEDHSSQTFQAEGLKPPSQRGRSQFVLNGKGTENDKPVDVRITITIDRNLYEYKKETRLAGSEFAFRDGYVMTRRNPPDTK